MKEKNFIEGIDFYYDDSGLMVLTQKYHLEKGYCCGNGCRHCPYPLRQAQGDTTSTAQQEKPSMDPK
jgi:hypothetical protein